MPMETVLSRPAPLYPVEIEDYRRELIMKLSSAWTIAREKIKGAQRAQKLQYDRGAKDPSFRIGHRVMVYMPGEVQGKDRKLARPFHGRYRIVSLTPTNAEVVLVDHPKEPFIFVALQRVRRCYGEMSNVPWTGPLRKRKRRKRHPRGSASSPQVSE